jgi:hypothetical protein
MMMKRAEARTEELKSSLPVQGKSIWFLFSLVGEEGHGVQESGIEESRL